MKYKNNNNLEIQSNTNNEINSSNNIKNQLQNNLHLTNNDQIYIESKISEKKEKETDKNKSPKKNNEINEEKSENNYQNEKNDEEEEDQGQIDLNNIDFSEGQNIDFSGKNNNYDIDDKNTNLDNLLINVRVSSLDLENRNSMINLNEKKSINKNENLNNNQFKNFSITETTYNKEEIKNDIQKNSKNENNENENKINDKNNLNMEIKKENNIQFNNNLIQNNDMNNIENSKNKEILDDNLEVNKKLLTTTDTSLQSNVNNSKIQIPKLKIQPNNQNLYKNMFDKDVLIVSSNKDFFTNKKPETYRGNKKINFMNDYDIDDQINNSYNIVDDDGKGATLEELIGSDKEKEKESENNIKDINFTLTKEEDLKKVMNDETNKKTNLIKTQTQNLDIRNIKTYTNEFNTSNKKMFNIILINNDDNSNNFTNNENTNINNNNTNSIKNNTIINNTYNNNNTNDENTNKQINNTNNSNLNINDIQTQNNKNNDSFEIISNNNKNNNNNIINNFENISIDNVNNTINKQLNHMNSHIIDNRINEFNIIPSFSKTKTFKNNHQNQRMGDLFKFKKDNISNEKEFQEKRNKQNYDLYGVVGDSRIFNLFPKGDKPKNDEVFSDIIYYFPDGKKEERCILVMTPKILFLVDVENYSKKNDYKTENIKTLLIPKKNISIIVFVFQPKHGDPLLLATVRRIGLLYYIKEYIRPNVKIKYQYPKEDEKIILSSNNKIVAYKLPDKSILSFDGAIKIGYLFRKERAGLFKRYYEKVAILTSIGLLIFENSMILPKLIIPIIGSTFHDHIGSNRPYAFTITTWNNTQYIFSANSEVEKSQWFKAFNDMQKDYDLKMKGIDTKSVVQKEYEEDFGWG